MSFQRSKSGAVHFCSYRAARGRPKLPKEFKTLVRPPSYRLREHDTFSKSAECVERPAFDSSAGDPCLKSPRPRRGQNPVIR